LQKSEVVERSPNKERKCMANKERRAVGGQWARQIIFSSCVLTFNALATICPDLRSLRPLCKSRDGPECNLN